MDCQPDFVFGWRRIPVSARITGCEIFFGKQHRDFLGKGPALQFGREQSPEFEKVVPYLGE